MAIKDFEFLHGAVLTRLLRKDEPLTLTLIETNKSEAWSAYKFLSNKNEDGILYIKGSKSPRKTKKHFAWTFTFNMENLKQLRDYTENNLYVSLVCTHNEFSREKAEICFLDYQEVNSLIDTCSTSQQSISVYVEDDKSLRVSGSKTARKKQVISRNRIDTITM